MKLILKDATYFLEGCNLNFLGKTTMNYYYKFVFFNCKIFKMKLKIQ